MVQFAGTYKHDHDENFEAIATKMGKNWLVKKLAGMLPPTVTVDVADDETWTLKTVMPMKTFFWNFKLGEEVELDTMEGLKRCVFTLDGNKLTQKFVPEGETDMFVEREFNDDGLDVILNHIPSGESGKRCFKRT